MLSTLIVMMSRVGVGKDILLVMPQAKAAGIDDKCDGSTVTV